MKCHHVPGRVTQQPGNIECGEDLKKPLFGGTKRNGYTGKGFSVIYGDK